MFEGSSNPGFCTTFTGAGVGVCADAGTIKITAQKIRITARIIRLTLLMSCLLRSYCLNRMNCMTLCDKYLPEMMNCPLPNPETRLITKREGRILLS
jgi:hypothetical protein